MFFPRIIQSWYVHVFFIYFHIFPVFVYICPLTRCLLSTRKHPSFQHTNCCQQNFPAGGRKSMTASGFFQSLPGTGSHCSSHHKKGVELRKMNQRLSGVAYITCYNYNYIRRPLPSFGLGRAAPGSTVGVQHGPVPALSFSMAPSKLQKLQKLLSGTFSATLPAAFDGLSLLCHGSSRGPTSCFCWASKLLSGTSEAPQAVSIGFRNCYLARFQHPLKAAKPSKPSQQPSTAFRCFAMGPPEAPRAVSVGLRKCYLDTSEAPRAVSIGLRNCYLARCSFRRPFAALPWVLPRPHKLFLSGFETAIWHVFSTP